MKTLRTINFYNPFLYSLMFFFINLFISTNTIAATDDKTEIQNQFVKDLTTIGITFKQMKNNIDITIDQQKAFNAIPILEQQGIISTLDEKTMNKAPLSVLVVIIGISSTLRILNNAFMNDASIKNIRVNGYVIPINSTNNQLCYSFNYDRDTFSRLDLNILTPRLFVSDTPGFTFSTWCLRELDNEANILNTPPNTETSA